MKNMPLSSHLVHFKVLQQNFYVVNCPVIWKIETSLTFYCKGPSAQSTVSLSPSSTWI